MGPSIMSIYVHLSTHLPNIPSLGNFLEITIGYAAKALRESPYFFLPLSISLSLSVLPFIVRISSEFRKKKCLLFLCIISASNRIQVCISCVPFSVFHSIYLRLLRDSSIPSLFFVPLLLLLLLQLLRLLLLLLLLFPFSLHLRIKVSE